MQLFIKDKLNRRDVNFDESTMADVTGTRSSHEGRSYDTFRSTSSDTLSTRAQKRVPISNPSINQRLIPGNIEDEHGERDMLGNDIIAEDREYHVGQHRGLRRRLFLILTEPSSSLLSAIFFVVLILAICISNLITIMQTMPRFQYRPDECDFCAEDGDYYDSLEDGSENIVDCVCPLESLPDFDRLLNYLLNFFAFEWTLRVLVYVPANPRSDRMGQLGDWFKYLTSNMTILDALAVWPYYIEAYDIPGLISLRLLRLFRVFQVIRLGSYNGMFVSLMKVMYKSIEFIRLLIVLLFFGATIFGSLMFW